MAPKIFLTGATGYIGGDALYAIYEAHPDFEYTLLVRNEEKGKAVAARYPKAKLVYGTLDSAAVIEKAAAEADVVVHTADSADNMPSAKAIAKGLKEGHTDEKPGYWIHLCGTGILQWYDAEHKRYGEGPLPDQKYHDIDDIGRIVTIPHNAEHRDVDEVVLAANQQGGTRTLIIGPPTIYGPGRGVGNTRSIQAYDMAKYTLQEGYAPIIAPGHTEWDNVHIWDLAKFFVSAVDAALDPEKSHNPEIFGPRAYFFLQNGVHKWADLAHWIAEAAAKQGFIKEPTTKVVTMEEAGQVKGVPSYPTWGMNSKSVAERAKKYLGWKPEGKSLKDETPDIVASEAKRLGK